MEVPTKGAKPSTGGRMPPWHLPTPLEWSDSCLPCLTNSRHPVVGPTLPSCQLSCSLMVHAAVQAHEYLERTSVL